MSPSPHDLGARIAEVEAEANVLRRARWDADLWGTAYLVVERHPDGTYTYRHPSPDTITERTPPAPEGVS